METFDEFATVDAVCLLVKLAGGRLNHTAALKLLYFADREALALSGASTTRGSYVSMAKGPVISEVYDLIKGQRRSEYWSAHLAVDGYDLVLKQEPVYENLSDGDEDLLRKHWTTHQGAFSPSSFPSKLIEFSHGLPEWEAPPSGGALPIPEQRILEVQGLSADAIAACMDDAARNRYVAGLSACPN